MKYCLPLFIWFISSLATLDAFGQVDIDYPSSRAIFQRDKNNNAVVYIAGKYTKSVDRIEAKMTAINGGKSIDWKTIQSNPQGGFYAGNLTVSGGWYELQVRGMKGDQQIGSNTISPVGVGEVFMIAGQSNAQGFQNLPDFEYGAQRASDDRVNCIQYNNNGNSITDLPNPPLFTHLETNTQISPRGQTAWSWGRLGDLLASRLDVPILFYNVAWEGTLVKSWRESINGIAKSPYIDGIYLPGMPYTNMRSVLHNYVPITGLRSVLWIQGEADNQFNTPTDEYANDLKAVIDESRNNIGKNISWVVSLTSYTNRDGIDNKTIDGQKKVINTVSNVFTGPATDGIQIPRTDPDGVHFHHEGLTAVAEAWSNQLNDLFFALSEPIAAISPLQVVASCANNTSVNLVANNVGYSSINWNTGQNSNSIQVGNGSYRATARDDKGNVVYSPEIRVTEPIQPTQPTISLEGSNPVCLGNTATLIANTSENTTWNTGSTANRLPVTAGGDYFVTTKNIYGCEASSSRISVSVLNSPLPAKPVITASGAVTFCEGGEVSLQSNSQVTNIWSTGARTGSISVKTSGDFRVQALDNVGCYSPVSDPVTVRVNSLPAKPVISLNGPSNFCNGGNVLLTSNYDNGNTWSNAAITKTVTVGASGTFTLKQTDANGCVATSNPVSITVYALPATPAITALRPTTFCLRDYTTLRSSDAYSYVWSNGSTNREIEVRAAGNFSIAARDQNGCVSPASAAIAVVVNPLPSTPIITADGPTVFCADLSVNLQSTTSATGFLWSNGAATQTLKVTTAGTYSVQAINEFKCYSDPSNRISTQTLALPPAPAVSALGVTTFCDGDFVALKAVNGNIFIWNTGVQKDTIHATQSGAYSARVKDSQGCFSPYSPQILVDVKVTPSAPVITKTGVYTLTAENNINAGDHVWRLNGTVLKENSTTLKAVQSGSYDVNNSVVYSPVLTCFSEFSAPFSFLADPTNNGMVAYPNPSDGRITIETLQDVSNATVQVIDSRGIIHKTFTVSKFDSQHVFNISDLPSGLYFIRILSLSFNASQKVIIVR